MAVVSTLALKEPEDKVNERKQSEALHELRQSSRRTSKASDESRKTGKNVEEEEELI